MVANAGNRGHGAFANGAFVVAGGARPEFTVEYSIGGAAAVEIDSLHSTLLQEDLSELPEIQAFKEDLHAIDHGEEDRPVFQEAHGCPRSLKSHEGTVVFRGKVTILRNIGLTISNEPTHALKQGREVVLSVVSHIPDGCRLVGHQAERDTVARVGPCYLGAIDHDVTDAAALEIEKPCIGSKLAIEGPSCLARVVSRVAAVDRQFEGEARDVKNRADVGLVRSASRLDRAVPRLCEERLVERVLRPREELEVVWEILDVGVILFLA